MKKLISKLGTFAFLLSTLFICTACPPDKEDPELTVGKSSISLDANGNGDRDIPVTASHTDWTATVTDGSSWLRVNKNGTLATVSADANTTTEERIGKIKITATEDSRLSFDVSVSQVGADGTISVSIGSVEFEAEGGSQTIQVTSNSGWNVSGNPGWLTVNPSSGTAPDSGSESKSVSLTASENNTKESRSCTLIFTTSDGKSSAIVTVSQKKPVPFILVNGSSVANLVYRGDFDGKSGVDYKQTVTVTSNVSWTASGNPSWLNVSPSVGNGTVQMEIYPTSENNSSSDRTAIITLSGDGISAKIEVTQSGPLSNAKVTPTNLVALYNQIGFDLKEEGKVNRFHWLCISENEMKRQTDNQLLASLLSQDSKIYVDDYMFFPAYDSNRKEIEQNTTYYVCTVAFDMDDKRGEVVKSKITTPSFKDGDNDAWVSFPTDEMLYGSGGFQFTAVKEGFCDTYHAIYGCLPSDDVYPAVAFAFEINYYIKNNRKHWLADIWKMEIVTNYPNNHTFTYATSLLDIRPLITIFARGVFKNGEESSDMTGGQWDVSGNNAPKKVSRPKKMNENIILRRSVEQSHARKFFRK